jgi:hypothetical protein
VNILHDFFAEALKAAEARKQVVIIIIEQIIKIKIKMHIFEMMMMMLLKMLVMLPLGVLMGAEMCFMVSVVVLLESFIEIFEELVEVEIKTSATLMTTCGTMASLESCMTHLVVLFALLLI